MLFIFASVYITIALFFMLFIVCSTDVLFFVILLRGPPMSTRFPYTTLFRSPRRRWRASTPPTGRPGASGSAPARSEEHTSELQSPCKIVCRLLLEKKNRQQSLNLHHDLDREVRCVADLDCSDDQRRSL